VEGDKKEWQRCVNEIGAMIHWMRRVLFLSLATLLGAFGIFFAGIVDLLLLSQNTPTVILPKNTHATPTIH